MSSEFQAFHRIGEDIHFRQTLIPLHIIRGNPRNPWLKTFFRSLQLRIPGWCCPRFDSPGVFASLLDDDIGGRFRMAPTGKKPPEMQVHLPDTNVLVTRFLRNGGVAGHKCHGHKCQA